MMQIYFNRFRTQVLRRLEKCGGLKWMTLPNQTKKFEGIKLKLEEKECIQQKKWQI